MIACVSTASANSLRHWSKIMSMPVQKPHRSKQDYGTSWEFIRAVEAQFGNLDVDLAARADNAKASRYIPPSDDSLSQPWGMLFPGLTGWLNPPFENIGAWAEKCAYETGPARYMCKQMRVIMLTPASVGSNWFAEHVHNTAAVLALSPRLTFEGCADPYPKDCMLSLFGFDETGFDVWRWK